jgi:hypothetical protein
MRFCCLFEIGIQEETKGVEQNEGDVTPQFSGHEFCRFSFKHESHSRTPLALNF